MLTYNEWMDALEEKAEKIPRIQAVLSNFQVLPRLGKLLFVKSKSCPDCKMYWQKLQESTEHLDEFFDDSNRYSINFDNLVEEILQHLKEKHAIRPKGFIVSIYTVIGMMVGVAVGIVAGIVFLSGYLKGGIILGWLLGLMSGWFTGKIKEEKMRKAHQIF